MINPEELRIGNWFTKDGEYHNVGHIQKNFYNICVNNYGPENIDPIPLTPEILEAVRFENEKELYLGLDLQRRYRLFLCDGEHTIPLREVKYLHELQNQYYALTGKELEVKLPQLV